MRKISPGGNMTSPDVCMYSKFLWLRGFIAETNSDFMETRTFYMIRCVNVNRKRKRRGDGSME